MALAAIAAATALHAGPASAGTASNDLDALVLDRADSPALEAMRDVAGLDTVRRANVEQLRPERYDMMIVDGHELSADELGDRAAVERFVDANRWIAVFDVLPSDHEALETHTGFDVGNAERSDRTEMFVFRISEVEGTPTVEMISTGPYSQPGTSGLGDRRETDLSRDHVRRVARLVERRIDVEGAGAGKSPARLSEVGCEPLPASPDPQLQHVGFCYTETGSRQTPAGYWTRDKYQGWMDSISAPGWPQVSEWTMHHNFHVFLNNPPCQPRDMPNGQPEPADWCHFQTVSYDLLGQFNPARGNSFFRMNDRFTTGWGSPAGGGKWIPERAWWTGRIDPRIAPSTETDGRLDLLRTSPATPNSETTYSEGEEYNVGFSATASLGSPTSGSSVGASVSAGYSVNNSKSYSIPDWGVQSNVSGRTLDWSFTARQPCDMRKWTTAGRTPRATDFGNYYTIGEPDKQCFSSYGNDVSPCPASPNLRECYPTEPKPLSKGASEVRTFGSWRTKKLLKVSADGKTNEGLLTFNVATPVTLVDTYCKAVWHYWCDPFGTAAPPGQGLARTGPDAENVTIDASLVNAIPIKELKLSPAEAKAGDKVTGEVVLKEPARIPVKVKLFSNSPNAVLAKASGIGGFSEGEVRIERKSTSGKFTIDTNGNDLQPGKANGKTARITAFYAEPTTRDLLVYRP